MHQPMVEGSRLVPASRVPRHVVQATPLTLTVGRYRDQSGM
jgi:hypothetical protein